MTTVNRQRLLVKTAQLYYQQELTQAEISKRLRLSRQKVQRLLREARKQGVVRINIRPVMGVYADLEQTLEQRFGLRESVVVETATYEDQSKVTREIGVGASDYLRRVVKTNDVIVISWGGSLLGMVDALWTSGAGAGLQGVKVIQGLGGLGDPTNETHAADLTRRLAKLLGGKAVLLPAPGVAGSRSAGRAFTSDPFVSTALQQGAAANLAFIGIGAPRQNSILIRQGAIVQWPELRALKESGAVGDMNLRYFNRQGQPLLTELNERVIGLTLEQIGGIRTVVGVAGGKEKLKAILGALSGNLLDVLVTDQVTAQKLTS